MEKYGTIPPKFTEEWWDYVWEYYKYHALVVGIVLFFLITSLYSYFTRTEYDMTISYIGKDMIDYSVQDLITERITPVVADTTGNEHIDVFYLQYNYNPSQKAEIVSTTDYAMDVKFTGELNFGDSDIYIVSKDDLLSQIAYAPYFADISEYVNAEYPEDMIFRDESGRAFAVGLKNSKVFADAGADSSNLYLAVRALSDSRAEEEENVINYNNSINAAKVILESE